MLAAQWRVVREAFGAPYKVSPAMVGLLALIPGYLFIAGNVRERPVHVPALPLEHMIPLVPAWAIVYGTLYLFLILLPAFVVRNPPHVNRMFLAYLILWAGAYIVFLAYPTIAPRPSDEAVPTGPGFVVWSIRALYAMDPPYNVFPSLHVAHSFLSAFICMRVDRRIGQIARVSAILVALSTLLTKQHWIPDVVAGIAWALVVWAIVLRPMPESMVSESDRRAAPAITLATACVALIALSMYWVAYMLGVTV